VLAHSLIRAFFSLLHPRMLALMVWPVAVALALWIALAVTFWSRAASGIDAVLRVTPVVEWMVSIAPLAVITAQLGWMLLALLFVPLVLITATLIIGAVAMPMMVSHIAERDYPRLSRRMGGGAAGSAWNALVASLWFAAAVAVSLPLWLAPPMWPALPALLLGYLNYRVFAYDALAEHASRDELARILRQDRAPLFALGVVVALAGHVPLLGFFAPLYGGLAFIHYGLARLQALRTAPIEGVARRVEE
jgi:CysZ protein